MHTLKSTGFHTSCNGAPAVWKPYEENCEPGDFNTVHSVEIVTSIGNRLLLPHGGEDDDVPLYMDEVDHEISVVWIS
ncbi:MAG: hypothetical protein GY847_19560 [Proteobacteria bacterium]|nr:hypothetical protein [Pseudomonadota bacterium]